MEVSGQVRELYCDLCVQDGEHHPAEGYCVDCREYLCSKCYKVHCRPAVCRHHRLQDKQSMPKVKPESKVKDVCTEICHKHNKIIEYFCNSHGGFMCSACITTQHRACEKVDFIPEIAATFDKSKELKDLQVKLEETLKLNQSNKSKISRRSKAITFQAEKAKLHVKELLIKIAALFDKLEQKIIKSIDELKDGDEQKMTDLAIKADAIAQELQKHVTDVESCLNEKKMCQLFVRAKHTAELLDNVAGQVSNIGDSCTIQRYQFKADPHTTELFEKLTDIGILDRMHEQAKWPTFEKDINVRTESDGNECQITGLTLLSEELLVIADHRNRYVKLADVANSNIKETYKTGDNGSLMQPFDVTKVDVAQIAVTYPDSNKIQLLDISVAGTMTMQREINAKGQCFGIQCISDNLIVSFGFDKAVEIISMTGTLVRKIHLVGNLNYTDYVTVNPLKNLVYVSSIGSTDTGSVICVTNVGTKKYVLADEKLFRPHGVSVDKNGIVYVCGKYSYNVVVLSEDCKMIQELLNGDDGLKCPLCLALSRQDDKLYIGMQGDQIKVFQLH